MTLTPNTNNTTIDPTARHTIDTWASTYYDMIELYLRPAYAIDTDHDDTDPHDDRHQHQIETLYTTLALDSMWIQTAPIHTVIPHITWKNNNHRYIIFKTAVTEKINCHIATEFVTDEFSEPESRTEWLTETFDNKPCACCGHTHH